MVLITGRGCRRELARPWDLGSPAFVFFLVTYVLTINGGLSDVVIVFQAERRYFARFWFIA
jgi:hypothetical protein